MNPMTAIDAFYATPFPSYEVLDHFVLNKIAVDKTTRLLWNAEFDANNYELLKRIFESRLLVFCILFVNFTSLPSTSHAAYTTNATYAS